MLNNVKNEIAKLVILPNSIGQIIATHDRRFTQTLTATKSNLLKKMKKNNALGMWIATGAGIGTAIGVAIKNIGLGIGIGVAIGFAIGMLTSLRNKNNDSLNKK